MRLIGALTSKPYAFKARPWELENINSIDFHDAHGTNIKVSIRGSEILRVLPRVNNRINDEWISDKIRFSYDGLNKQRIFYPLLKSNNKYKKISWEDAFTILKIKIKNGYFFNSIVGQLVDLESLFIFKRLLEKIGKSYTYSTYSKSNNDLRHNFLMNTYYDDIQKSTTCIIVDSTLRIDSPILDLKVRKKCKAVYNLNSTHNNIYLFARNKHILTNYLNTKAPQVYFNYLSVNKLSSLDLSGLTIKKNWWGVNFLHLNSNAIAESELNWVSGRSANDYSQTKILAYMFNTFGVTNKKGFSIYHGHTGSASSTLADLILPGSTLFEKNSTLLNNEGLKQELEFCVKPPALARNDWKIFEALANFLELDITYHNINSLRQAIKLVSPDRTQINILTKGFIYKDLIKIQNGYLLPYINNFYITDIVSKTSNTLALAANRSTRFMKNFKQSK